MSFAAGFAGIIVVALAVSLLVLDRVGVSSRTVPVGEAPAIVTVNDSAALLTAWEQAGVRGAAVVDVTRDLGFATLLPEAVPPQVGWPVTPRDLPALFGAAATRPTFLWATANTGITRSVTYVLTPADLAGKVRFGRENGRPGIAADGMSISTNDEGYLRFISSRFPPDPGPAAILNIDASYLVTGTTAQLMDGLGDSPSRYRLITLDRARDATDVPEAARIELDRAAALLRERVSR